MTTLTSVNQFLIALQHILEECCETLNCASTGSQCELIINIDQTRYLIIDEGWIDENRIHTLIFDAEIRDGKIWLHHDGLDHGITDELVAAGVPKDRIVLAFHPLHVRPHTGYAIA
jgi:XisI protein